MGTKQRIAILCVAMTIIALSGFLPGYYMSKVQTAAVVAPARTSYTPYISCSGVLQAKDRREVYALHPVMVEKVYVKPGDWVEKGDILADVDLETTQIMLSSTNKNEMSEEALEKYRALAKEYGLEDRIEDYLSQNIFSAYADPYVSISESIVAQTSGKLLSVNMTSGCLSDTAEQLYTITPSSNCSVLIQVEERDISLVKEGSRVLLTGARSEPYHAVVTQISPEVTEQNNLLQSNSYVEVWADLQESDPLLRPGLSVQAKIATGDSAVMTMVPYQAIAQDQDNREYVYQFEDGKAVKRFIDVAKEESSFVYVSSGLKDKQLLLLDAEKINPNGLIKIEYEEIVND